MQKIVKELIVVTLAGACFARGNSGVAQIMTELQAGTSEPVPVQQPAEAVVSDDNKGLSAGPVVSEPVEKSSVALAGERRSAEDEALDAVTAAWNGMILRDYQLSHSALEKMRLKGVEKSTDVRDQFPDIEFPEGAKAVYRPVLNKLYVLNTKNNIEKFETVIAALEAPQSVDKGQIEIKARFIEFSEGALEELGFKWSDVMDGNAPKVAGDWSVNDGSGLFTDALRGSDDVFVQPETLGSGEVRAAGDWTASRLTDQFDQTAGQLKLTGDIGPNLDVLIRALDQASGADVLSAPSVVTRAGEKAKIQVGQMHRFPEVFDVGGDAGTILHASYQEFSEKLMGVELDVKPVLTRDNFIEMDLNPKITELLGWRNYEICPRDSAYTFYQYRIGLTFEHDPIVARLPIFRHREVKTKITIKDGSTIGMGGLISDKTESFSDRVPVLGSLPLVGRLFRSEGERSVKRNLMIFVTATKVAPNGRIISKTVERSKD